MQECTRGESPPLAVHGNPNGPHAVIHCEGVDSLEELQRKDRHVDHDQRISDSWGRDHATARDRGGRGHGGRVHAFRAPVPHRCGDHALRADRSFTPRTTYAGFPVRVPITPRCFLFHLR